MCTFRVSPSVFCIQPGYCMCVVSFSQHGLLLHFKSAATHLLALPVSRSLPLALLLTTGTFLTPLSLPRGFWTVDTNKRNIRIVPLSVRSMNLEPQHWCWTDSAAGAQFTAFQLTPWLMIWFGVTSSCISSSLKWNKFNNYWVSLDYGLTIPVFELTRMFQIYYRVNFSPLSGGPCTLSSGDLSENLNRDISFTVKELKPNTQPGCSINRRTTR